MVFNMQTVYDNTKSTTRVRNVFCHGRIKPTLSMGTIKLT